MRKGDRMIGGLRFADGAPVDPQELARTTQLAAQARAQAAQAAQAQEARRLAEERARLQAQARMQEGLFAMDEEDRLERLPQPRPPPFTDVDYSNVMRSLGATAPPSDDFNLSDLDDMEGMGYSGGATNEQIGRAARYRTYVREAVDQPKYQCLYRNLSYIVHSADDGRDPSNPLSTDDKYDAEAQRILDTAEANLRRVTAMRDAGFEPKKIPKCSGRVFKPETTPAVQPTIFKASTRKRAPDTAFDFTEGNTSVFKPSTRKKPASAFAFDFTAPSKYLPPAPPMKKASAPSQSRKFPLFVPTPELVEAARLKRLEGRGMVYPYLL
jgi:hypothetical protein